MSRQHINIGTVPRDRTGDPLRDAMDKINDNFIDLYAEVAPATYTANSIVLTVVPVSGGTVLEFTPVDPTERPVEAYNTANTATNEIQFVWDDEFFDDIWSGEYYDYQVSLDDGDTWIRVNKTDYTDDVEFGFETVDEANSFVYDSGDAAILSYAPIAVSANTTWFNAASHANSSIDANTVIGASINYTAVIEIVGPGDATRVRWIGGIDLASAYGTDATAVERSTPQLAANTTVVWAATDLASFAETASAVAADSYSCHVSMLKGNYGRITVMYKADLVIETEAA
jgi:hypothetical protein